VSGRLPTPVRASQLVTALQRLLRRGTAGAAAVVTAPAEPTAAPAAADAPPAAGVGGPIKILLAEDNVVNQLVAKRMLEQAGVAVEVAPNGREALRAFTSGRYDLVFMDLHMPEMDGFEATMRIREWEGSERRTPIVAVTASVLEEDRRRCFAVGMDDFVGKPVQSAMLRGAVAKWVRRAAPDLATAPRRAGQLG
jgi:CheY-like chemotaxis protein